MYERHLRALQCTHYANANKARKHLANRLKAIQAKTRISHLSHPTLNCNITNPQAIADEFTNYYSALYNLREDSNTPLPSLPDIQSFLTRLHLPSLTDEQLQMLNVPFTDMEISKSIDLLWTGKAPGPNGIWILQIICQYFGPALKASIQQSHAHLKLSPKDVESTSGDIAQTG